MSLDRAAEALSLSQPQLRQYLVTGQILVSMIYHKPSDYRERYDVVLKDGSNAVHIKTSRTVLNVVSPEHKINPLTYLDSDDTARILLNKVPNREMLVSRLFYDRTLSPRKGIGLVGDSAVSVTPDDLVISSEELGRFAKYARIRIKSAAAASIDLPQKPWYDRPIGRTGLAILGAVTATVIGMSIKGEF
ncbi:hypothetical protein [Xanthomonas euroxanthea]|uniref:hypothetical protein n=1 Tax=Xanthomonas euroxanthea TaxID=2259622 RepID=UPI001608BDF7|nr:hypothetical protein [Xanthomonas euroxanthea]MBB5766199.1 hypothetical protein [Xanthomonas euroxanthea]